MAEGKAGGAAGLFAKQVQKKFSRAQEKVGSGGRGRPGLEMRVCGCPARRRQSAPGSRGSEREGSPPPDRTGRGGDCSPSQGPQADSGKGEERS